jgi:hypothetical protein
LIDRSCGSDRRIRVVVHADAQLVRMGIRGLPAGVSLVGTRAELWSRRRGRTSAEVARADLTGVQTGVGQGTV